MVDDGSTDADTIALMEKLQAEGEHLVIRQTNQGLSAARNIGIKRAQGQYILPLDADNKVRPDYISKAVAILDKHSEIGVVYGNPAFFGETWRQWSPPDFDLLQLLIGNYIDACAVFREKRWEDCLGYDTNMPVKVWEDYDLWLTAVEKGWQFHHSDETLFDYRVRSNSMVAATFTPDTHTKIQAYVLWKHVNLYISGLKAFQRKAQEVQVSMRELEKTITTQNVQIAAHAQALTEREKELATRQAVIEELTAQLQWIRSRQ
ncbi:MAG: glycosyltransferase family 2 protein, partial [Fimbriimonadaceae bacterium]